MNPLGKAVAAAAMFWLGHFFVALGQGAAFVNFETAPVHPVAISPNGQLLAVCNLPDGNVELFDLTSPKPAHVGAMFTGVDPVSARFNSDNELWVINQISDSISVIDPQRLVTLAMLDTFDAPADVVFTRNPPRAYVSHAGANVVEVWNTTNRQSLGPIDIDGDRPKAMAVSADESEIYIAILESGNGSTIIAPPITSFDRIPPRGANDLPDGPEGGANPFPNSGDVFDPIINPKIPSTNLPPRVSLIVRKQNGRWMDDNHGDWTEYITGTNAFLTGRTPGWDVADHDLAILSTKDNSVRYVRSLMNICFDVAVNPASGKVAVIGTDAINEVRFEPNLKSIFTRMRLAVVDPTSAAAEIHDLNPHLDYKTLTLPLPDRRQSVGDPRAIAWNSRGTRAYVAGMGSDNLIVMDENGARVGPAVQLPSGPAGIAFDGPRNRLYVFCRFDSKLVTLDADSLAVLDIVSLHDSTPDTIRKGRKHFYNTIENSGLGQASCASCHVDGRFDRLAWDLGDQTGNMIQITNRNFLLPPETTNSYHPMKGPMVTQTLQDIIGHEPFHWRGDRDGLEGFEPTFKNLQGADAELPDDQMQEFKDFLATITFPPNPFRNLDNTLPTSIDTGEKSLGRGIIREGNPLPRGNATRGLNIFRNFVPGVQTCMPCHTLPSGVGPDAAFINARWQPIPVGAHQEHHAGMLAQRRTSILPFKGQQLRNLFDKFGFNLSGPVSRSGFGFFHDGRVDTLTRFIQESFGISNDQDTADIVALLLAFTGSDLPAGIPTDPTRAPGLPSHDAHAAVGLQSIVTNNISDQRTLFMMSLARASTSRVDLIVHAMKSNAPRGWLMRGTQFISDKNETNTTADVLALATPQTPVVFTLVPLGSGARLALDRDGDGFFNQLEIEAGSDPADATITPETTTPRLASFTIQSGQVRIEWVGHIGANYRIQTRGTLANADAWTDNSDLIPIATNPVSWSENVDSTAGSRFYRIVYVP